MSPSASNNNLARASGSLGSGNLGSESALGRLSLGVNNPYLMKLESIASSAVRCADKVAAKLIIVYTTSGAPTPACWLHLFSVTAKDATGGRTL